MVNLVPAVTRGRPIEIRDVGIARKNDWLNLGAAKEMRQRVCYRGSPWTGIERAVAVYFAEKMSRNDRGELTTWISERRASDELGFSIPSIRDALACLTGRGRLRRRGRTPKLAGEYRTERAAKAARTRSQRYANEREMAPPAQFERRETRVSYRGTKSSRSVTKELELPTCSWKFSRQKGHFIGPLNPRTGGAERRHCRAANGKSAAVSARARRVVEHDVRGYTSQRARNRRRSPRSARVRVACSRTTPERRSRARKRLAVTRAATTRRRLESFPA